MSLESRTGGLNAKGDKEPDQDQAGAGSIYAAWRAAVQAGQGAALVTVVEGERLGAKLLLHDQGEVLGSLGAPALDAAATEVARERLAAQSAGRVMLETGGESAAIFVDVYAPPPQLIIVGAVHIADALVTFARPLGFRTVVVDGRPAFATPERFPHADRLVVQWPADALAELPLTASTYCVFLTHDGKIDNPALLQVLAAPVRYVGALGSRRTHERRVAELEALGATPEQIRRIHAPIGLDLGGRRPEEIALAIMAEIVAVQNGRG